MNASSNILTKIKDFVLPSQGSLGIDIGTTSIKVVEINREAGEFVLRNYGILENFGHLERENAILQDSSLKIMEDATASLLKKVLEKMKVKTRQAVFSLPVFSSFTTIMDLPKLSPKEINQTIPYQARQYIPIPLSEVMLDWQVLTPLAQSFSERTEVLLMAIPSDVINRYSRIAQLAGVYLKAMELESLSLARSVVNDDLTTLVIDVGSRASTFSVVDKRELRMSYSIDTAGNDFTVSVSRGLNLSPLAAEELKRNRGLMVSSDQRYLPALITPYLDVIINEAKKIMTSYYNQTSREIKKIILSGGGVLPYGIKDYFQKEFNLETQIANPFSKIKYDPTIYPIIQKSGASFSIAAGAALKIFS